MSVNKITQLVDYHERMISNHRKIIQRVQHLSEEINKIITQERNMIGYHEKMIDITRSSLNDEPTETSTTYDSTSAPAPRYKTKFSRDDVLLAFEAHPEGLNTPQLIKYVCGVSKGDPEYAGLSAKIGSPRGILTNEGLLEKRKAPNNNSRLKGYWVITEKGKLEARNLRKTYGID